MVGCYTLSTPLDMPLPVKNRYGSKDTSMQSDRLILIVGTGVVTSVPSDAPDDFAALRDLQNKEVC